MAGAKVCTSDDERIVKTNAKDDKDDQVCHECNGYTYMLVINDEKKPQRYQRQIREKMQHEEHHLNK